MKYQRSLFGSLMCVTLATCSFAGCYDSPSTNNSDNDKAICGDGILSESEACDLSSDEEIWKDCGDFDASVKWKKGGTPGCDDKCQLTVGSCKPETPSCGNKKKESYEACDGDIAVPESCSGYDDSVEWLPGGSPACSEDCSEITKGTCEAKPICGDGVVNQDSEECDGEDHVPASCEEFDSTKEWAGGSLSCSKKCKLINECIEKEREFVFMNWNVLFGGLDCYADECISTDTAISACLKKNCLEKELCMNSEDWVEKADKPMGAQSWTDTNYACLDASLLAACTNNQWCEDCSSEQCDLRQQCEWKGKCTNYNKWGGKDVLPRVERWIEIVGKYKVKPDIISIVETSSDWHSEKATMMFNRAGYDWVDNTREPESKYHYLANVLYKKDKFEMLEHGHVRLLYDDSDPRGYGGQPLGRAKAISMYGVFKEKETNEIFIASGTHWDANNVWDPIKNQDGSNPNVIQNVFGWVVSHELNRVRGARDVAAKLNELKAKYPDAHIVYGGDLNTFDFNILFNSNIPSILEAPTEALGNLIGLALSKLLKVDVDLGSIFSQVLSLKDFPSLIRTFNALLSGSPYPQLPQDFVGSHQELVKATGLTDARTYALENIPGTVDSWSTSEQAIAPYQEQITELLKFNVVIDYAFFSADNLKLTSYKVMTNGDEYGSKREDYMYVSDHFPVRTTYTYTVAPQQ